MIFTEIPNVFKFASGPHISVTKHGLTQTQ